MAFALKCDRCGKYYEENKEKVLTGRIFQEPVNGVAFIDNEDIVWDYDLCDECIREFKKFMGMEEEE